MCQDNLARQRTDIERFTGVKSSFKDQGKRRINWLVKQDFNVSG